jgi:alkylation response protein AidB-like acyl-CoA dehydrogenase
VAELLERCPPAATPAPDFWAAQYDAGLAWVDFPAGAGGAGLDPDAQAVVDEALTAAGAPRNEPRNLIGVQMMAPVVAQFGTDDQRARFLRPAFTCAEIWCQLFSEPGAGSDLASLATRAVRAGDEWRVTGQKVWTTLAHVADLGLLLARTDPDVPKHAGITCFAIDMRAPGVEVRPLRQITGEAEYNEVFLDEARVPDHRRIGEVGHGWSVAMATLANERGFVGAMSRGATMTQLVDRLRTAWATADPARRDPTRRQRLVRLWCEAEALRLTSERAEAALRRGQAGPDATITKSAFGELSQRASDLCLELGGPESLLIDDYVARRPDSFTHTGGEIEPQHLTKAFLAAQSLTIAGGTTNINKNVIGERVLGLPREPRPDRQGERR